MASCFKQFGQFPTNWLFSAQIVHSLLLREIKIDGASENELLFSVSGKKARFGQREFCLVTGLRFGKISEIINMPYIANENGIHKRYFPEEEAEELKLSTVYDRFVAGNFLEGDDSLKMALFLIVNNVLFGQLFDKKVTPWLFNLVDDLEAFNGFAWGHYVFKMTLHYLRHGFRSRNSNKGYGKVRYLYGFSWAVEVVDNLIDGFGMRLQDTLPRMRHWTMHKRPRNFVQTISDLEANIRSEKAHVKEVLEATDDEARANYCVGVDYNMTEGPQFIPSVEMEMKEKHELLDEGDNGDDGVIGNGDGDGDGDDGVTTSKRTLKRKPQKNKKKTSVKKKQRKAVPVTSLDQEEDYTPGYTPTPHVDYTPGYTPTPHIDYTPGYTPTSLPPHPHMSSRQEPRSRSGDRITELLEAVRALPDVLDDVVKREVSNLPGETLERRSPLTSLFFMELEDPTKWLSTDTKLNLAWKKILQTDNEAESSFDALAFECPQDWIDYGCGNRPGWGNPWCCVFLAVLGNQIDIMQS
ncbi:hypothetical protein Ddye_020804 [Dipteronia dyeriana]|uniref:DUF1985 domain-containing protein n=1 Tax=Dipteronia dyeriana TaxID=168575 RepID=A0AAD9U0E6_9ROSI|nr:hypothetical protein Ddye_020804 [Dipteronia dyeriana]